MSFDETTHEWHLTPRGWIKGTFRYYDNVQEPGIIEPPSDRVETWVREMVQSSGYSKEDINWKRVWESPKYTEEELQKLRKKYPKIPENKNS